MKNKRIWSALLVMIMVLSIFLSTNSISFAAQEMKYLKVNDTVLEFKEIVYLDSTNGDDTTGDGSKDSPFKTVIKGFNYMNENCREEGAIIFKSGEYNTNDIFTGISDNIDNKYNKMKLSLIAETMGTVTLLNLRELVVHSNNKASRISLKLYGFKLHFNHPGKYAILGGDDWGNEIYNCIIPAEYGGFTYDSTSLGIIKLNNCVFNGKSGYYYTGTYALSGSAENCASTTSHMDPSKGTKTNALYNVTLDSNYNITSAGWQNAGSGINPDGSKGHIGVYGGQFAWGSKAEQISGDILEVVLEPSEQLLLSVDDDILENEEVNWESLDTTVASVDANGKLTAHAVGRTVITVTNDTGSYKEEINVLVVDCADDYRLAVDLKAGEKCRLTFDGNTKTKKVIWTSADTGIATVTSKGKVKAIAKGLVMVTAADDKGNEKQVYVRVR